MTYQEAYQKATGELKAAGIPEPESDAWILLEHVTGMTRTRYYVDGFGKMPEIEKDRFFELVSCRKTRIPVQHLTGVQEFMGYEFAVNEHVLVPRQDTEILVEEAEKRLRQMKKKNPIRLLDMCTGSGCIPISLKLRNPQIFIEGADISEEALKVAGENARKLRADGEWIRTDMFENITGIFDMITSNPPYIPTQVIEELEAEVRFYDPYEALDGKEDGLYFYRILAAEVPDYLTDGGWLVMEIGHDQSAAVENLLKEAGFEQVSTQKDLAGLDRVVSGVYNRHSK